MAFELKSSDISFSFHLKWPAPCNCNFSNHLRKAPRFIWIIWRKHLVLLGLFEGSTLFYLVYLKKAPCFTWIPLQLDFSLTQVALVRRLEVEDFNWDSQKWIFFATFSLLSINRQFWGSDNLPRSRESHWSPAWVKIVWIFVQNFTLPVQCIVIVILSSILPPAVLAANHSFKLLSPTMTGRRSFLLLIR